MNYLVAAGGAWLTSVSEPHGVILPIFTLRESADRASSDDQDVVCVDNRGMLARTAEIQRLKIRYVAVISHSAREGAQEAKLLEIDRFLQVVKNSVDRSNTGDLAGPTAKASRRNAALDAYSSVHGWRPDTTCRVLLGSDRVEVRF